MNFGLPEQTLFQFQSVFAKYPEVTEVLIYGSRAKGNFREGSDIDLTLKGDKLSAGILRQIEQDLDELNTPYLLDLSIHQQLTSESLKAHINRVGRTFYKKQPLFRAS